LRTLAMNEQVRRQRWHAFLVDLVSNRYAHEALLTDEARALGIDVSGALVIALVEAAEPDGKKAVAWEDRNGEGSVRATQIEQTVLQVARSYGLQVLLTRLQRRLLVMFGGGLSPGEFRRRLEVMGKDL